MITKQTVKQIENIIELLDTAERSIKSSMQILAKLEDNDGVIEYIHDYELMSIEDIDKIRKLMNKFKTLLDGYKDIAEDKQK